MTGLVATPGDGQVSLSWTARPSGEGVTSYRVYRALPPGGATLIASPTSTSYVSTGLTNNATYEFYVAAVDAAGNVGTSSATASATPVPSSASGLSASIAGVMDTWVVIVITFMLIGLAIGGLVRLAHSERF